jgi:hypothetical protein
MKKPIVTAESTVAFTAFLTALKVKAAATGAGAEEAERAPWLHPLRTA